MGLAATRQALGQQDCVRDIMKKARSYLISKNNLDLLEYIELFQVELMLRQGKSPRFNDDIPALNRQLLCSNLILHPEMIICRSQIPKTTRQDSCNTVARLTGLSEYAHFTANRFLLMQTAALKAVALETTGNLIEAHEQLEKALDIAEPGGYIRIFLDLGKLMSGLLQRSGIPLTGLAGEIMEAFNHETPIFPEEASNIIFEHMTQKELQILGFLKRRYSNKEIANDLSITAATVKSHTIRIYQKLNVNGRKEAVDKATKLGIFPL